MAAGEEELPSSLGSIIPKNTQTNVQLPLLWLIPEREGVFGLYSPVDQAVLLLLPTDRTSTSPWIFRDVSTSLEDMSYMMGTDGRCLVWYVHVISSRKESTRQSLAKLVLMLQGQVRWAGREREFPSHHHQKKRKTCPPPDLPSSRLVLLLL